jgi:hypothetical protein
MITITLPRHSHHVTSIVLAALVFVGGDIVRADDLLNVDFGIGLESNKQGPAALGQDEDDFWNLYSRDDGSGGYLDLGVASDLRWSDQRPSSVRLTVANAPEAWSNGSIDPMFSAYLYPLGGGDIVITLDELEPGNYTVLVYAHGLLDGENGVIEVTSGATVHGSSVTTTEPGWNTVTWTSGQQYVSFDGVVVVKECALVVRAKPGTTGLAVVNGLQLLRHDPAVKGSRLWNIDFSRHDNPHVRVKSGAAAIGSERGDFWNSYSGDDGSGGFLDQNTLPSLVLADGTPTPVGLTVSNAAGLWLSGHSDPMLDSYLYPSGHGNVEVTITDLPAGSYDFYFYAHGFLDEENGVVELRSGDTDYGTQMTTTTAAWRAEHWEEGLQYVRFRQVQVAAQIAVVLTAKPGTTGLTVINGMQILRHAQGTLPPSGLVAWWRGEGDGEDTTGANDGELVGDVGFEDGYVGQAFRLDGQSGRVAVPASASLNVSSLTVEAWINPGDVSVQRPIVEYALEAGHAGVHLWHSVARPMGSGSEAGTLFANVRGEDGQSRFVVSEAGLIEPDEWSHVALTYDDVTGVGRLYVNGLSVAEEFLGTFVPQTSMPLHLGYRPIWSADGGAENPFLGLMDEVAIYSRALSAEEIGTIHAAGREGKSPEGLVTLTTVAGAGGTIEREPDLGYYSPGTPVVLTALAEPGFTFVEWAGDVTGTANPLTIEVTRNVTLSAVFAELGPERILRVVEPAPRQEGQRIHVPLVLSSGGDVGGMTFVLRYDSEYLTRPELAWTSESGLGLNEVNVETPGEVHGTFALPGVALPAGDQRLARVTFRARSVPETLRTPLEVEVLDVSNALGDPLVGRTRVEGNVATILVRRLVGDNNANHRLDVGDATVIQRLLIGLDPVRPWDVSGNDVNESGSLDSGDVIRVLRAAAGIDSQPLPQSVSEEDGGASLVKQDLEVANSVVPGDVRLVAPVLRASPGETITVQVRLDDMTIPISAVAMRLDYPIEALRLASVGGHRLGDLVPESAVAVWNVGSGNDYGAETGSLVLGASSAGIWPSASGVLAEITFQVQEGQTAQRQWPILLSAVEVTPDGFELFALQEATVHFIGRDPLPPLIDVPSMELTSEGFELSVTGEAGALYIVEASADLIEWLPVASFMGTGDPVLVRDVDTTAHGQRFYRVRPE